MNVKDRVAVVTGASSGIGLATAKLLSKNGAKVVLAARSLDKLERLSKELPNSLAVRTDMLDKKQVENLIQQTVKKFGRIDILVNNAGRGYDAFIEEIDLTKFEEILNLDLVGPLIAIQQVLPFMRKQGQGAIVNVSSGTALMALPGMGGYSSIKRALAGLSLTANEEFKGYNISVSVIYPYITATNFEQNTIKTERAKTQIEDEGDWEIKADHPELIAEKVLEAIETGQSEIYAHDWMKKANK